MSASPGQWVCLRYFASTREAMGMDQERWQTQALTLGELRAELQARGAPWSQALADKALRMALNRVLAAGDAKLTGLGADEAEAEVAFFPPVTGG